MRRKGFAAVVAVPAILAVGLVGTAAASGSSPWDAKVNSVENALKHRQPKNVIYLIGDGMGTQEITAARYYLGVQHKLNIDRMTFTGLDTTWSVKPGTAP